MTSLLRILTENKIELLPSSGGRFIAHCPFHKDDNTPSFTIYPNGTYFCFGCSEWGDAVKFLVDYKGMSDKDARELVGEELVFQKADKAQVIKVQDSGRTYNLLFETAIAYHDYAKKTMGPLSYLNRRGINDDTIAHYKLGYSDGHVLNWKFAHEYVIGKQIGLISSEGHEVMSHRITIPNLISGSMCDFMMGRTVTNDRTKYLGTRMPKPIFGFWEVRHSPIIFIAEGHFDWLLLRQNGFPAAVIGGTHLARQNRTLLRGKKVVVVPDNDAPGVSAAQSLKQALGEDAMILDYSSLGVKDIGEIEANEELWKLFQQLVMEQVGWLSTYMSRTLLKAYFPNLIGTALLPLT
jgi:DNA primase